MDSSDLRIFRIVAREGSITQAAARLGFVQSNVTARIKRLESELGTTLFFRHNRGMKLTSTGKILLSYADRIVGLLEEATQALSATLEPIGPLMIGSSQTIASIHLPKLFTSFYKQYPGVILSVTTGDTQTLIKKVLDYDLDGAFISHLCVHPDLQSIPCFNDELVIVAAEGNFDIEEITTRPILVLDMNCIYKEIMEQWMRDKTQTRPHFIVMGTVEAIIGGVEAGLGISLLPKIIIKKNENSRKMHIFALDSLNYNLTTEFIIRRDSFVSSTLSAFLDYIKCVLEIDNSPAIPKNQG
ncbi:DNA-binding transcriptional LysR family regulator [Paenibacillus taihuensis]|uniref:DNA-binding transcriptional LysR family regulator n=1 Tax=Paenibacillus taihuensis TaxID=1156355 RepID=A0A3D9RNP2_9BACL|nr:LysR family transcriptional regulator [Paenibacillus taihuensis]REE77739.1 DNA-binding transcriptional LysR family regulator [Paenibacillus taihuensis]